MLKRLSLSLGGVLLATQAFGHQVTSSYDIGKMAQEANLVFRGTVVDIDYRGSQASKNQRSLPHTFVTFEVSKVFHGKAPRKTFTLRFLGGVGEKSKMMVAGRLPKFDIGDEDVLFVSKNGVGECPLVDCANGRFRVIDEKMFNEFGQRILSSEKGELVLGSTDDLDEVNTFYIGDKMIQRRIHKDSTEDGDGMDSALKPEAAQGKHLDSGSFINSLLAKLDDALPDNPRGIGKRALHADKNKPFFISAAKPVALPEPKLPVQSDKPLDPQERFEIEMMQENGGDPVID